MNWTFSQGGDSLLVGANENAWVATAVCLCEEERVGDKKREGETWTKARKMINHFCFRIM